MASACALMKGLIVIARATMTLRSGQIQGFH